ncbi:lipid-A-disaccharide synthase N-terminal domain-containing protein [Paracoccus marcusii]|uniref:Lipid-A-disaccharide synthase N-terminal domain-containing protein n=1 Tax=Paracoccus marcusii TaxID=59779 RepID=A0ABY7UUN2_9RHOB|nr:lipid-A-disaccharide synthase N-terminal domain-containing protein [Paracoccus marcusii]WDA13651.1 lipid-A-disaccharide synthase N-terminal domain-containing protein [Paracoccus marcusii]
MTGQTVWLGIGSLGQALFSARFVTQWLASERMRRSVVPHPFLWVSLAGGVTLFAYASWRGDPVFVPGQGLGLGLGLFVYRRNLMLIRRHRQMVAA